MKDGDWPRPDMPADVVGNRTDAQGKSLEAILFLSALCMPRQRTRSLPSFCGSKRSSTTPTKCLNSENPKKAI
jgi:hypothetical protein